MKHKLFSIIGLLLVLLLAACSGDGQDSSEEAGAEDGGTTNVRIMSHFFSSTPPEKDGEVEKEIEKATNTELDIEWVSANNYPDKFNVMLASGDLPDLMLVPDPFAPSYRDAAQQGAFWDVAPFIDDYPNLKNGIEDIAWELTSIDGKNYGIPRPRPTEGDTFFVLRQDWLDNVGLEMPTNSEELYQVMKAFTEEDPDQDGEDNTIGFTGYINPENMGGMIEFESAFTGVYGEWKEEGGKLTHTAFLPETRDSLEYLAKAYDDGYIAQDFASLQISQAKDMFKSGKAGMISEKTGTMQEYYDPLVQQDPDFEYKNLMPVTNINGFNPKGAGFSGVNVIPKSVPEAKVKEILAMMDRWMEDDVFSMHTQGIEGIHHTIENGEAVLNSDQIIADAIGDYSQIVYKSDPYASTVKPAFPEEIQEVYKKIQDERAKTSVANIGLGLYSETGVTYQPILRKNIQDLKTKIILGSEPLSAWDSFVEELKNDPEMQKLTEEVNESYANR